MNEVNYTSICITIIMKAVQCAPLIAPYVNHVNTIYLFIVVWHFIFRHSGIAP